MNLHQIACGAIGAINPQVRGSIQVSTGTATVNFREAPTYAPPQLAWMQVQALTAQDLRQLDSLNVSGSTRAIYVNGRIDGLLRVANKGGDLIILNSDIYLVTAVLEAWPDWTKVAVTLQDGR